MTIKLCPLVPDAFTSASDKNMFFGKAELLVIDSLFNAREKIKLGCPGDSCKTNLFFGFFFDGTKNNYIQGAVAGNQSNVARLYDCFPGQVVEGVLPDSSNWKNNPDAYSNFYKVYAPGVASPFKAINDTGKGSDLTKGAGFGYLGEDRIKWALIQAINNIHRHYYTTPLLGPDETLSCIRTIRLTAWERQQMSARRIRSHGADRDGTTHTVDVFAKLLKTLHSRLSVFWPDLVTKKPRAIGKAQVEKIYVSAFGFSRGSAQARAFTNWLMSLCALDAELCQRGVKFSLGGFELEFNFVGLFDTVASVGIANTLGDSGPFSGFDGHAAWADAEESLRIHKDVQKCLHLVAAHEVRRSFPVDSVSINGELPANCEEVIFPGVHSDLGSGYCPLEQGRGLDPSGADMLARVPLLYMYREARLSGVPLKLDLADETVQNKFKLSIATVASLNYYLAFCSIKEGKITDIMREQGRLQILWHKGRRGGPASALENSNSFSRATNFDKNDLHSANLEFEVEIKNFDKWRKGKGVDFIPGNQDPGFNNNYENEWEEIAGWWDSHPPLPDQILTFFDDYVHDSHAWFKLESDFPDNEPDLQKELVKWELKRKSGIVQAERQSISDDVMPRTAEQLDGLTADQRRAAQEYAATKKTPRLITVGRESDSLFGLALHGGYLRFRKIYGGADKYLLSDATEQKTSETENS